MPQLREGDIAQTVVVMCTEKLENIIAQTATTMFTQPLVNLGSLTIA